MVNLCGAEARAGFRVIRLVMKTRVPALPVRALGRVSAALVVSVLWSACKGGGQASASVGGSGSAVAVAVSTSGTSGTVTSVASVTPATPSPPLPTALAPSGMRVPDEEDEPSFFLKPFTTFRLR